MKINDQLVKLEKFPTLLGVTFDTMYSFSTHIKNTVIKARSKLNVLKSLAGSTWGQDKDTMLITYKSTCRSTLEYAAPIWTPAISETSWSKLQSIQNQALRLATGCLRMSSIDHIHQETKVLPVKEHSTMFSKQFTASFFLPRHPGHKHLNKPKAARNLK